MTVQVSVKLDVSKVKRYLSNVEKKQIPFASAQALNDTQFDNRQNMVKAVSVDLDRPTPFTKRGFRVIKASKRKLWADLEIPPDRLKYMRYQIFGGTRLPRSRVIIIGTGKRNQYGNTRGMRNLRNTLLNRAGHFEGESRNGTAGIWKYQKRKGVTLVAIYVDKAQYRPRFNFFKHARRVTNARFVPNFNRRLKQALLTAR